MLLDDIITCLPKEQTEDFEHCKLSAALQMRNPNMQLTDECIDVDGRCPGTNSCTAVPLLGDTFTLSAEPDERRQMLMAKQQLTCTASCVNRRHLSIVIALCKSIKHADLQSDATHKDITCAVITASTDKTGV